MKRLILLLVCVLSINAMASNLKTGHEDDMLIIDLRQCDHHQSLFAIKPETGRDEFIEIKAGKNVQHINTVSSRGNAHAESTFDGATLKLSSFVHTDENLSFDFQMSNAIVSFEDGMDLIPHVRMPVIYVQNEIKTIHVSKNELKTIKIGKCAVDFNYK